MTEIGGGEKGGLSGGARAWQEAAFAGVRTGGASIDRFARF